VKTAVLTAATKSYAYAMPDCAAAIARSIRGCGGEFIWIIATDKAETVSEAVKVSESFGLKTKVIETGVVEQESRKKYKEQSQVLIAGLQQACMDEAIRNDADIYFSVESDVIIHPDSYRGLKWLLECPMESHRFDVAAATYFNGSFLCGRGTPRNHICEDFEESERNLPKKLFKDLQGTREEISKHEKTGEIPKEILERLGALREEIKKCPPKGNVFSLNSKKWRKRGWLDAAYPGAACLGAVLPTDWCGLGCTMWGRDVMRITDFCGYEGMGTQDLYLVWNKWHPAGKRIGCLVSTPGIHVKPEGDGFIMWEPFFVPNGEETSGHIRIRKRNYQSYQFKYSTPLVPERKE